MYVKLFQDLLDSTIWMEKDHVVRVWLTLLLLADSEGYVEIPIPALAQRARVALDECAEAIDRLEAPDPYSRTSAEDGRRLIRVTDERTLWQITNYEYYRSMRSVQQKREYQKRYMREYRKKGKKNSNDCENLDLFLSQSERKTHELAQAEAEEEADTSLSPLPLSSGSNGIDWVTEVWNETAEKCNLPKVQRLTDTRKKAVLARIAEHGDDALRVALEAPRSSKFLRGEGGRDSWNGATFDWLIAPKNFAKVIEGNYADKKGGKGHGRDHSAYDGKL